MQDESYFAVSNVERILSEERSMLVKFYARICKTDKRSLPFLYCEDTNGRRVRLESSAIEFDQIEQGEWYRFLGEWSGGPGGFIRLLMRPVFVDGYEEEAQDKILKARDRFLVDMDSLVGYAIKHK